MASTTSTTSYTPPPLPSPFNHPSPQSDSQCQLIPIYQGAEAHLYKTTFLTPTTHTALKIRPSKPYRHPILDRRLTRARILQEARCLAKLVKEGVAVPALLGLDWEAGWLAMEWVPGNVVRVVLEAWEGVMKARQGHKADIGGEEERKVRGLLKRIGGAVGALHRAGVIHGDLTTSNLMLRPDSLSEDETQIGDSGESPSMEGDIVLIDFGLASQSSQDEDRAVDLYVLERAFGSSHPRTEGFFEEVLAGYRESYKGAGSALKRLEDVRMRGRKRSMIG
ncbi:kinase-like domain-containing protein [Aspergillus californicus]